MRSKTCARELIASANLSHCVATNAGTGEEEEDVIAPNVRRPVSLVGPANQQLLYVLCMCGVTSQVSNFLKCSHQKSAVQPLQPVCSLAGGRLAWQPPYRVTVTRVRLGHRIRDVTVCVVLAECTCRRATRYLRSCPQDETEAAGGHIEGRGDSYAGCNQEALCCPYRLH